MEVVVGNVSRSARCDAMQLFLVYIPLFRPANVRVLNRQCALRALSVMRAHQHHQRRQFLRQPNEHVQQKCVPHPRSQLHTLSGDMQPLPSAHSQDLTDPRSTSRNLTALRRLWHHLATPFIVVSWTHSVDKRARDAQGHFPSSSVIRIIRRFVTEPFHGRNGNRWVADAVGISC